MLLLNKTVYSLSIFYLLTRYINHFRFQWNLLNKYVYISPRTQHRYVDEKNIIFHFIVFIIYICCCLSSNSKKKEIKNSNQLLYMPSFTPFYSKIPLLNICKYMFSTIFCNDLSSIITKVVVVVIIR